MDVNFLNQAANLIVLLDSDTQKRVNSPQNSEEDPILGLEGSDLSDCLRDRAELEAIDAAFLGTTAVVVPVYSSDSTEATSSYNSSAAV